jgi:hypothetical protein
MSGSRMLAALIRFLRGPALLNHVCGNQPQGKPDKNRQDNHIVD